MDTVSIILVVVFTIVVLVIVIASIFAKVKRKREETSANCDRRMQSSEKSVAVLFNKALSDCLYKTIVNDVFLPGLYDKKKKATQVDTLIICEKGIFVIETKCINGRIYGNEDEKEWTIHYDNGDTHNLYNPVWQNNGHVKRVRDLIKQNLDCDVDKIKIIPAVIFVSGDITHVDAPNCYHRSDINGLVNQYPKYLDTTTIAKLTNLFSSYKNHPVVTMEEHIEHVEEEREKDKF